MSTLDLLIRPGKAELWQGAMQITYFANTDTALVELSETQPVETRELNENVYLDLDADGRVVSLTIEHAMQSAAMDEFTYQFIPGAAVTDIAGQRLIKQDSTELFSFYELLSLLFHSPIPLTFSTGFGFVLHLAGRRGSRDSRRSVQVVEKVTVGSTGRWAGH